MKPSDVIIGACLDMSGSMSSLAQATRDGFNEYRREQALEDGNAWLSLVCFDTVCEEPFYAWNCRDIPDLTDHIYRPRGMTALYDAYAHTIHRTEDWLRSNLWFGGKVTIMLISDGHENRSQRYTQKEVRALSAEKRRLGWEFVVFGAGVNAKDLAFQLGIDATVAHQFEHDPIDTGHVFAAASYATTDSRLGLADSYAGGTQTYLNATRTQGVAGLRSAAATRRKETTDESKT